MRNGVLVALAVIGSLAVLWVMLLSAMVTYDAVADDDMMDGMWEMMGDMGDMHGMMGGGGPETTGAASGRGEVTIEDFRFQPTTFNVTPGTVITWTNEDGASHTATARDSSFDTGRLGQGDAGEVTFDTPGTFEYVCSYHPSMQGRVVVRVAQAPTE